MQRKVRSFSIAGVSPGKRRYEQDSSVIEEEENLFELGSEGGAGRDSPARAKEGKSSSKVGVSKQGPNNNPATATPTLPVTTLQFPSYPERLDYHVIIMWPYCATCFSMIAKFVVCTCVVMATALLFVAAIIFVWK